MYQKGAPGIVVENGFGQKWSNTVKRAHGADARGARAAVDCGVVSPRGCNTRSEECVERIWANGQQKRRIKSLWCACNGWWEPLPCTARLSILHKTGGSSAVHTKSTRGAGNHSMRLVIIGGGEGVWEVGRRFVLFQPIPLNPQPPPVDDKNLGSKLVAPNRRTSHRTHQR